MVPPMKTSNHESAEYIAEMCKQLSVLAFQHEFIDAARLLQMVHLEITQYCEDSPPSVVAKN